jgi:uncharacterized protein (UPF0297 family)
MSNLDSTMKFDFDVALKTEVRDILTQVQKSLIEKGYNPVNQMVGYLLSGDPTYITSYNNARQLMKKIERDEIIEVLLKEYLESK